MTGLAEATFEEVSMSTSTEVTYHTVDELCHRFRVSRPTVEAWIRRGHLHAVKLGRSVRIADDELRRFEQGLPAA